MAEIRQLQAVVSAAVLSNRVLRLNVVLEITGLSRASIYRRMANGSFPRQVSLGGPRGRAVGWRERDIEAFLEGLTKADAR
jgi:prophage regulatory protein